MGSVMGSRAIRSVLSRPVLTAASGLVAACVAFPALSGDVVHLKDGGRIEGEVNEGPRPGTLEVRKPGGPVVVVERSRVERIEAAASVQNTFDRRLERLRPDDLDGLVDLLVWAREKRFSRGVQIAAERILEIDTHHELARKTLGYVVFENRWVRRSELDGQAGLVLHQGEWVTEEEKAKRLRRELRRQFTLDLEALASENTYVRELALRKIRRYLRGGDPAVRDVVGKYLDHREPEVRKVAVAVLARFPVREEERSRREAGRRARRLAEALHQLALHETDGGVRRLLRLALARFYPAESFRLALETATATESQAERDRAADALYYSVRKAFLPELCDAVTSEDGSEKHEAVREVLRRIFRDFDVDFGYRGDLWLQFWEENASRFYDET